MLTMTDTASALVKFIEKMDRAVSADEPTRWRDDGLGQGRELPVRLPGWLSLHRICKCSQSPTEKRHDEAAKAGGHDDGKYHAGSFLP